MSIRAENDNLLAVIEHMTQLIVAALNGAVKDSIIRRLVKVGAKVVSHAKRLYVHVASGFSLPRYYRIIFD